MAGAQPAAELADGEPIQLTTHSAEDRSPAWAPDGKTLLFASDRDGQYEIYSIPATGGTATRRTLNPGPDESPAWSPAGDRFVFQSERDGVRGLWTADWPGGEAELLFEDESPELLPDVSPDGRWIAFTSKRDGNAELYRFELASGAQERLTENSYRDAYASYLPDGRSLVFFSRRGTQGESDDLYRLDLEDGSVTRLTHHPGHHDFVPDVSPDGRTIVAGMSDRAAGHRELVLFDAAGTVLARFGGGYHRVFHPAWSPDGTRIAYAARLREGERADLFIVRVPGR